MIYLFESGDTFSIVYDETTLTDEQLSRAIIVENLPEGEGILKRNENREFYYEPVQEPEISPEEPTETLEQKIDRLEMQIQLDNIIQFEVLATIYEELLMKG